MAFCDCQCRPSRDRVWPDVSFALYLASVEVALRQLFAPRQADGDRLLWGTSTMFTLSDVFHFFAHELPCLGGRRFAFSFVFTRPFCCFFFFWHTNSFRLPRHIWTLRKICRSPYLSHNSTHCAANNQCTRIK